MTPEAIMNAVKQSEIYIYYMFMFNNSGEKSINFYHSLDPLLQEQIDLVDKIRVLYDQIQFYKKDSPNQSLRVKRIQEHYQKLVELQKTTTTKLQELKSNFQTQK